MKNICYLSEMGAWERGKDGSYAFEPNSPQPFQDNSRNRNATHAWSDINQFLRRLSPEWLFEGNQDLMTPRQTRMAHAESLIGALISNFRLPQATIARECVDWGSDGSMKPASAKWRQHRIVTTAVTGPRTIVLRLAGKASSILQGKILGIIVALLSATSIRNDGKIYSDHINSVRLINNSKTKIGSTRKMQNMNTRSYYRWLLDLNSRIRNKVQYTPGHKGDVSLPPC